MPSLIWLYTNTFSISTTDYIFTIRMVIILSFNAIVILIISISAILGIVFVVYKGIDKILKS